MKKPTPPVTEFFIARNADEKPWEAALEWLIGQNLQPDDVVLQKNITTALGMIDPNKLSYADTRKWELSRLPEVQMMIAAFEERTGLILEATSSGGYMVIHPNDVAQYQMEFLYRRLKSLLDRIRGKLARADRNAASPDELQRRASVSQYVNNLAEFVGRKRRPSLDDPIEDTAA